MTTVEQPAILIDEALDAEGAAFDDNSICVVRDLADVGVVYLDRQGMLLVLKRLIQNAVQALCQQVGQQDRVLLIRLTSTELNAGLRLRIEVNDNGIGIAPQHVSRVFAYGFTTDNNRQGYGLHEAFMAARKMHGTLSVSSAGEGRGATFALELPAQHVGVVDHSADN